MTATEASKTDWFARYGIRHLALIPDGNRRWARARGLPIEAGHGRGLLVVLPRLVDALFDAGVHTLSVWTFSTENWNRTAAEVEHLMGIFAELVGRVLPELAERHDARVRHLGRKDRLPSGLRDALARLEGDSAGRGSRIFNLALDYGGHDELDRASERLLLAARGGAAEHTLRVGDFLDTSGLPHPRPDLVVRSAGERRLSGFMPLQTAYSELFFVEPPFPDVTFELLEAVAEQFSRRARRFGG